MNVGWVFRSTTLVDPPPVGPSVEIAADLDLLCRTDSSFHVVYVRGVFSLFSAVFPFPAVL